ncbi:MAG: response regulator [Deltaproteobacteria bacterium]|nr:response regulator [Deltaproteobacteria bacterium]
MKLRLLIVDDDRTLLSALKTVFDQENVVTVCNDGKKAIDLCRNEKFDLIITDLMMPGANGLEVLTETRKIDPDCLVVLITGFASLETAVQAIREGAYDYITKPFKLEEIKIIVNNAREKIRLIRENKKLIDDLKNAYEELNMMKKLLDINNVKSEENNEDDRPVIAGSMLPFYYSSTVSNGKSSILDNLERISDLKEKGLLTGKEFELCKSKLFNSMGQ